MKGGGELLTSRGLSDSANTMHTCVCCTVYKAAHMPVARQPSVGPEIMRWEAARMMENSEAENNKERRNGNNGGDITDIELLEFLVGFSNNQNATVISTNTGGSNNNNSGNSDNSSTIREQSNLVSEVVFTLESPPPPPQPPQQQHHVFQPQWDSYRGPQYFIHEEVVNPVVPPPPTKKRSNAATSLEISEGMIERWEPGEIVENDEDPDDDDDDNDIPTAKSSSCPNTPTKRKMADEVYIVEDNLVGGDCPGSPSSLSCTGVVLRPHKKRGPRPKQLTEAEKKQKRSDANDRERQRMGKLNTAFDTLRTVLPKHGNDRELSKFETIQIAKNYIRALNGMLIESEGVPSTTTAAENEERFNVVL